MTAREAAIGDLCVLLAGSRPLDEQVTAFLARLRERHGGTAIDPLHVTIDRIPSHDVAQLRPVLHECASAVRPAAVCVDAVFGLRSKNRGGVLKLEVPRDRELDGLIERVKTALRAAGAPSLYGPERWVSVSALECVTRPVSEVAEPLAAPIQLFVGDTLLLSRIAGAARYEILDTASIASTG